MDFRIGEGQKLLVATARDVLRKHCSPELLDQLAADARGFPDHLWRSMAELGWMGLLVPGEFGGSEGSLLDVILLLEEMGRVCLPGPYLHSAVVATSLIASLGSQAQRRSLLPVLANGARRCALALLEENGELSTGTGTRLDGGRLTGRKLFVKDAHLAQDLLVLARHDHGASLVLLEAERPGLAMTSMPSITDEQLFDVTFAGVTVDASDILGSLGQGLDLLAPALRIGALGRSAEMLGCAERILELVVEHAKSRVQSGRPIGAFQAVQHACADLLRNVESARPLLYSAAWKVDQDLEAASAVAMAKSYVGDACLAVARKAHQVFGAISYCEEHTLHRLHKRIIASRLDFGDNALHQETVARAIGLG